MFWQKSRPHSGPEISLLIPWANPDRERSRSFAWLRRYWRHELPNAEVVVGQGWGRPFSKTSAFNDAARRSSGRVLVLIDADAYLPGSALRHAARRILDDLEADEPLHTWFIPYRRLYRLSEGTSERVLESDPHEPWRPPDPCPPEMLETGRDMAGYGRRYGAMVMVIPREAWEAIGGFDERFRGWGGEDASTLRALDTLWGKHKSIDGAVYHLWHQKFGDSARDRRWKGQRQDNPNGRLASRYSRAARDPEQMRIIIEEARAQPDPLSVAIRFLRRLFRG